MPHLIYIKHPAPERDPRLDDLLNRIRSDDHSSYRGFETPAELAELIVADVATLLADRFDASRAPAPVAHPGRRSRSRRRSRASSAAAPSTTA